MAPESTVVVVGRSPEKMRAATAVLERRGFTVVGVFSEADALQAITGSDDLLAVVAGGSVSAAARDRLRAAAASRCAVIVDAAIGHADPAEHFTSEVLPHLVAAHTARAAHGSGDGGCRPPLGRCSRPPDHGPRRSGRARRPRFDRHGSPRRSPPDPRSSGILGRWSRDADGRHRRGAGARLRPGCSWLSGLRPAETTGLQTRAGPRPSPGRKRRHRVRL